MSCVKEASIIYRAADGWVVEAGMHIRSNGSVFLNASVLDRRLDYYRLRYVSVAKLASSRAIALTLGNLVANQGFTVTDDDLHELELRTSAALDELLK